MPMIKLTPELIAALKQEMLHPWSTLLFEMKGGGNHDAKPTRLYLQGVLVARASGYGYSKDGSCWVQVLRQFFPEELTALLKACGRAEGNHMRPNTMDYVLPGPTGSCIAQHLVLEGEGSLELHPMGGANPAIQCLEHITRHHLSRTQGTEGTPMARRDVLILQPWPAYPLPGYMVAQAVKDGTFPATK